MNTKLLELINKFNKNIVYKVNVQYQLQFYKLAKNK